MTQKPQTRSSFILTIFYLAPMTDFVILEENIHTDTNIQLHAPFTFSPSSLLLCSSALTQSDVRRNPFFFFFLNVFSSLHARHVLQIQMQTCTTLGWTHKEQNNVRNGEKERKNVPRGSQIVLLFSTWTFFPMSRVRSRSSAAEGHIYIYIYCLYCYGGMGVT